MRPVRPRPFRMIRYDVRTAYEWCRMDGASCRWRGGGGDVVIHRQRGIPRNYILFVFYVQLRSNEMSARYHDRRLELETRSALLLHALLLWAALLLHFSSGLHFFCTPPRRCTSFALLLGAALLLRSLVSCSFLLSTVYSISLSYTEGRISRS